MAHGIALRCSSCSAALPIELDTSAARCAFCGHDTTILPAQRDALARHLDRLAVLAREADDAAADRELHRRRSRRAPGWLLAGIAPLLLGLWVVLGLGVGGAAMFGVFALLEHVAPERIVGSLASLTMFVTWGLWVAAMRLLIARRYPVHALAPATIDTVLATCDHCGARLPVRVGHHMECPFCGTHESPDATTRATIEDAMSNRAGQLRVEAQLEEHRAARTRTPHIEGLLRAMSGIQLVTIVIGGIVAIVSTIAGVVAYLW